MKKLFIVVLTLAMVASFLPKAEAGESATLGLQVTFAVAPEPIKIWSEPEGPFTVKELETLEFKVIAEDMDTANVSLRAEGLPPGAEFPDIWTTDAVPHREGIFRWTPKIGQAPVYGEIHGVPAAPYLASFIASNSEGETANLSVEINVVPIERIISIELNIAEWQLTDVKLGEQRSNVSADGLAIHKIVNTGNVPVTVDFGYGVGVMDTPIHPGLTQDVDTYITKLGEVVLPPDQRMYLDHPIEVGMGESLPLTYGAPTALSVSVPGMSAGYEVRAYPANRVFEPPDDVIIY